MSWQILLVGYTYPAPFFLACLSQWQLKNPDTCFPDSIVARGGHVTQIRPMKHTGKSAGRQGGRDAGKDFSSLNEKKETMEGFWLHWHSPCILLPFYTAIVAVICGAVAAILWPWGGWPKAEPRGWVSQMEEMDNVSGDTLNRKTYLRDSLCLDLLNNRYPVIQATAR